MVLECSKGKTNTAVAAELRVSKATVGKWRSRFLESRLDGLVDEPRPSRPRTVTDADVERVVTLTLETTPKDATHFDHPAREEPRSCAGQSHPGRESPGPIVVSPSSGVVSLSATGSSGLGEGTSNTGGG